MKRMLTHEQFRLLMNRNRIENVWSVMRLNYNLVYHRDRYAMLCRRSRRACSLAII